jgi:anti-anti-sigma factor
MSAGALTMDESRSGNVCVVGPVGKIDSMNAEALMTRLQQLIADGGSVVLVDLSRVTYLTSAGFRALMVASHQARRKAARLALCGMSASVRELFELGDLLDAFTIYGPREEALAQLA